MGKNKTKCDLSLTDKSKTEITLTLWGSDWNDFDSEEVVVVVRNGVVTDYNGVRSLNCGPRTLFWHNPNIDGAEELKLWFDVAKEETLE